MLQAPEDPPNQSIFYKGQFYDAFKFVIDIVRQAKRDIVVIDNYLDESVLELVANKQDGITVTFVTSDPGRVSQLHLEKFEKQYGTVSIVFCKDFHDRFVILDNKEVYAFGASLKDLGNKCFEVSKNKDATRFVSYVNEIINSG